MSKEVFSKIDAVIWHLCLQLNLCIIFEHHEFAYNDVTETANPFIDIQNIVTYASITK